MGASCIRGWTPRPRLQRSGIPTSSRESRYCCRLFGGPCRLAFNLLLPAHASIANRRRFDPHQMRQGLRRRFKSAGHLARRKSGSEPDYCGNCFPSQKREIRSAASRMSARYLRASSRIEQGLFLLDAFAKVRIGQPGGRSPRSTGSRFAERRSCLEFYCRMYQKKSGSDPDLRHHPANEHPQ
jgi:hypothetical protein